MTNQKSITGISQTLKMMKLIPKQKFRNMENKEEKTHTWNYSANKEPMTTRSH